MQDYTKPPYKERTTIDLYEDDLACIADIQKFRGILGKAATIRFALRHTRATVTPGVLVPPTPAAEIDRNPYGGLPEDPDDVQEA